MKHILKIKYNVMSTTREGIAKWSRKYMCANHNDHPEDVLQTFHYITEEERSW